VVNKALQQYLRCFINTKPNIWGKYLHLAEWHYNTSIHSSTRFSPFQVVFGKPPPALPDYIAGSSQLEALNASLTDRDSILSTLRKKLEKAQTAMKLYVDKKRLPHPFKIGDMVLVKLRPYRQTSVSENRNNKLSKQFFGPFQIIQQIGKVAFKLQLPPVSKIHLVFHASQLKPFYGTADGSPLLPTDSPPTPTRPIAILAWKNEPPTPPKVLVQWSNTFPEDSTWEAVSDMAKAFPDLHLEDKVPVDGEWDVMNLGDVSGTQSNKEDEIQEETTPMGRAKRKKLRPKWLNDYEVSKPTK